MTSFYDADREIIANRRLIAAQKDLAATGKKILGVQTIGGPNNYASIFIYYDDSTIT